ncbi:MAG: hypothetical protein KDD82_05910 [Planctomycetes bacterium]|nr:hypothetical protein [Planctomycetota bacterium]
MKRRALPLLVFLAAAWPAAGQTLEPVPGHLYGSATLDFELAPLGDGSYAAELALEGPQRLRLVAVEGGWALEVARPSSLGLADALAGRRPATAWGAPFTIPLRRWNGRLLGGGYDLRDPSLPPPRLNAWERATYRHRDELLRSDRFLPGILDGLEDSPRRLKAFVQRFPGPDMAARLIELLAEEDSDARRLAVHWVFDASRQRGYLSRLLAQLEARQPNAALRELIAQAQPTRRPIVIAHRGNPVDFPENTLPAIVSAVELGADGLEVDLCLTLDDRIVVWHDQAPGGLVTLARNLGLEGGVGYQPVLPSVTSSKRRPTHELTLAELRANYGYARRRFSPFGFSALKEAEILDFDALAVYLEHTSQLRRVLLDLKLPTDEPALQRRFAQLLRPILRRHALADRVVLMNNDPQTTAELKRVLGDEFLVTRDVELPGGGESAVSAALELGNCVASVGRPRLFASYDGYLEILRADRARIEREGLGIELITWTLDDPLELREVLAIGVDGIVTNQPARLVALLEDCRLDR